MAQQRESRIIRVRSSCPSILRRRHDGTSEALDERASESKLNTMQAALCPIKDLPNAKGRHYLLERREGMEWPEARAEEAKRLQAEVGHWLNSKGALDIARSGTFAPEDGSGSYTIQSAADGPRTWWMVQLQEDNAEGRRFSTAVSITNGSDRVSVYVTLETGWINARIMPVPVDPKCPRIVREPVEAPGTMVSRRVSAPAWGCRYRIRRWGIARIGNSEPKPNNPDNCHQH